MSRISVAAIAIALALAGCPLPQPLPTYPAGNVTPPRILPATTTSGVNSIIPVPAGCLTGPSPSYPLDARIFYSESNAVEARWFVDYRSDTPGRYGIQNALRDVPANPNPVILERQVPTFTFQPYGFAPPSELGSFTGPSAPGIVHVVELVVSNGFDNSTSPPPPEPNRTPGSTPDGASKFEIQTYRWVFVNVPAAAPSATCLPADFGCVKCPP